MEDSDYPKDGDRVRFKRKRDVLWETGRIRFWWNCMGEPTALIDTVDGTYIDIHPEYDALEPAPSGGRGAAGE